MCACVCKFVCARVCVCVRERERHRESVTLHLPSVLWCDDSSVCHPWPGMVAGHVLLLQGLGSSPVLGVCCHHPWISGKSVLCLRV